MYKILFTKSYTSSWLEEVSVITKVKNAIPWSNIINDLNVFLKINFKKQINKNLGRKKQLQGKTINYMPNGKVMIIDLIFGLIKKIFLYKNKLLSTL